jgi:hypothetical protein
MTSGGSAAPARLDIFTTSEFCDFDGWGLCLPVKSVAYRSFQFVHKFDKRMNWQTVGQMRDHWKAASGFRYPAVTCHKNGVDQSVQPKPANTEVQNQSTPFLWHIHIHGGTGASRAAVVNTA